MHSLRLFAVCVAPLWGCAATPTVPDAGPTDVPAGTDAAAISAFLAQERYREAPWLSETSAPRERSSTVSPHDRVRVWLNSALVTSQRAGNGKTVGSPAHPVASMAVKEFYDAANQRLGRAAMLKLSGNAEQWAYYCDGPDARCGAGKAPPIYSVGSTGGCGVCHGGLVFTHAP